jgi:hypothetical protein
MSLGRFVKISVVMYISLIFIGDIYVAHAIRFIGSKQISFFGGEGEWYIENLQPNLPNYISEFIEPCFFPL